MEDDTEVICHENEQLVEVEVGVIQDVTHIATNVETEQHEY